MIFERAVVQNAKCMHRTLVKRAGLRKAWTGISVGFAVAAMAWGQAPGGPGAPGGVSASGSTTSAPSASQTTLAPQQGDPTYQGSVPQGTASPNPIPLT